MKVVKAATLEWSKEITCQNCGSVLEVELNDLHRICGSDQRDGDSWDYATFTCAVCGTVIRLNDTIYKSIPAWAKSKIRIRS